MVGYIYRATAAAPCLELAGHKPTRGAHSGRHLGYSERFLGA